MKRTRSTSRSIGRTFAGDVKASRQFMSRSDSGDPGRIDRVGIARGLGDQPATANYGRDPPLAAEERDRLYRPALPPSRYFFMF
jgi:hypothetical protein